MPNIELDRVLRVGIALSAEKDDDRLLEIILDEAMDITGCDGGTLYILKEDALHFRVMVTRSTNYRRGGKSEPTDLPPVALNKKNVCACCAIERRLINVSDVYCDERYDFSGPRRYDAMTGYRTQSMLVVPMEDDTGAIIGVLQLINAQNDALETIAFNPAYETVISSIASMAAISLTNMNYQIALRETLDSFVRVMSTAIDARTPYNANHTRNMVKYGERFLTWLNANTDWQFTPAQRREFLMSVWLHDVGKLVIPLSVMNKESRLGRSIDEVGHRFREIALLARIDLLGGAITKDEYDARVAAVDDGWALVQQANSAGFLPDDMLARVQALAARTYTDETGAAHPFLTSDELALLSIRKGTLTADERKVMESHVVMTNQMLSQMKFTSEYSHVVEWASAHHEHINGRGYPNGLGGDSLCREVRLLSVLDVFDALTARDRPYKKPMPAEKAFDILSSMASEGQLDADILSLFRQSGAWELD